MGKRSRPRRSGRKAFSRTRASRLVNAAAGSKDGSDASAVGVDGSSAGKRSNRLTAWMAVGTLVVNALMLHVACSNGRSTERSATVSERALRDQQAATRDQVDTNRVERERNERELREVSQKDAALISVEISGYRQMDRLVVDNNTQIVLVNRSKADAFHVTLTIEHDDQRDDDGVPKGHARFGVPGIVSACSVRTFNLPVDLHRSEQHPGLRGQVLHAIDPLVYFIQAGSRWQYHQKSGGYRLKLTPGVQADDRDRDANDVGDLVEIGSRRLSDCQK
ncbi:hypothetical protein [Micromonospora sp. NPDC023956]|uniref:hypothetical protein n=1 Tax=Micromonospora sp. NPDC023956 TaxID=3155722 RepID=UPI0033C2ED94